MLDTGCQINHPDLVGRIVGGKNFSTDDKGDMNCYDDYNGHGTHVAGTIGAVANNMGVVGVAPESSLLIVKVLDRNGVGSYTAVANGIRYAISQNVDIITMSFWGPVRHGGMYNAIKAAVQNNIAVVCAAANSGDGDGATAEYAYPATYNEVIAVGAVSTNRNVAFFSNSNNQIDVTAPGVNIFSTYLNSSYATFSGTSMATPHVAGAIALLISWGRSVYGRKLSEVELYAQLVKRTLASGVPVTMEGNGMVYLTAIELLDTYVRRLGI